MGLFNTHTALVRFKPLLTDGTIARLHGNTFKEILQDVKPDGSYTIPQ